METPAWCGIPGCRSGRERARGALGRLGPGGWSLTLFESLTLSHRQNCYRKFRPTTWRVLGTGPDVIFLNRSSLDSQISPTRTDLAGSSPFWRRRRKREAAAWQSPGLRIPWARPRFRGAQVSAQSGSAPRQLQAAQDPSGVRQTQRGKTATGLACCLGAFSGSREWWLLCCVCGASQGLKQW